MKAPASMPNRWWLASLLFLSVGTVLSAYLFARTMALLAPTRTKLPDLCALLFSTSCDATLADPRSWLLGVPIAAWALVGFTTLAVLLFLSRFLHESFAAEAFLAGCLVALVGVIGGSVASLTAWLGRGTACAPCLIVVAMNAFLLVTVHKASSRTIGAQARLLRVASDRLLRFKAESQLLRWKQVGLATAALAGFVTYQWLYVEATLRRPHDAPAKPPAEVLAAYRAAPRHAFAVAEDDPRLGSLDAPVQLVVFESFRCSACRGFAPTLSRIGDDFGDQLLVVFKHYPLSARCNPRLTSDQQPGACEIHWAAEAARSQGRFWSFHDAVFATAPGNEEDVIAAASHDLHLDPDRFDTDRRQQSAADRVAADIELGNRLKIPGTPAVFLNGRLVRTLDAETLGMLIREELLVRGNEAARLQHPAAAPDVAPAAISASAKAAATGARRSG